MRFGIHQWMVPLMEGIKNVDVYEFGKWYDYGEFKISTGKLYHDVENCFFRIEKNGHKTFRATDTFTLEGIQAKNYDILALEHNYNEELVEERIKEKRRMGRFAYEVGAVNSHLSEEQAKEFIFNNAGPNTQVLRLHESRNNI